MNILKAFIVLVILSVPATQTVAKYNQINHSFLVRIVYTSGQVYIGRFDKFELIKHDNEPSGINWISAANHQYPWEPLYINIGGIESININSVNPGNYQPDEL